MLKRNYYNINKIYLLFIAVTILFKGFNDFPNNGVILKKSQHSSPFNKH